MNLYDINKMGVAQMAPFTDTQWAEAQTTLNTWMSECHPRGEYFMLYNKEVGYFTLFKHAAGCPETFFNVLKDCLNAVGTLKAFDVVEDKSAIEIWLTVPETEENAANTIVLYLFNYDSGVVYYG